MTPSARAALWLRRAGAAVPDLALAVSYFFALSRDPRSALATNLAHAAMLEFFVIHASGFLMWPWLTRWGIGRRMLYVGVLAAGYSIVLGGIALGVGGWWPLTIFWSLMANRMLGAVLDLPGPDDVDKLAQPWAGATTLFVVVVMGVGLMGPARRAVLAGGGAYFLLVALSELSGWRWVDRWMAGARRRAGG